MKDYLSSIKIGDDARTFDSSYTYPKLRNHADNMNIKFKKEG